MCMLPSGGAGAMAVAPTSERAVRLGTAARRLSWVHLPVALGWCVVAEWTGGLLDLFAFAGAFYATRDERFVNLSCVVNYFIANLFLLLLLGIKSMALLVGQPFGVAQLEPWQLRVARVVGVAGLLLHAAGTFVGYRLFNELRRLGTEEGLVGPDGAPIPPGGGDPELAASAEPLTGGGGGGGAAAAASSGFVAFQGKGHSLR